MDYFADLRLQPDPEFKAYMLMDALFAKLHRALTEQQRSDIGISFPDITPHSLTLGHRLRLHGNGQGLEQLFASDWLKGMRDHCTCLPIAPVPTTSTHALTVRRVQAKGASDVRRLRKRLMARTGCSETEASQKITADAVNETLKLPFVTLRSSSTGQTFKLFIRQQLSLTSATGNFNAYGLSPSATIPAFD